jgi:myo-inositol 2-dehydrogenase/D-chiro-inositol 1-dehydrogenase
VVGESGTIALGSGAAVQVRGDGRVATDVPAGYQQRFADAYRDELQAWVDAAAGGSAAGPGARDGLAATAVAEACVASLRDRGPVDVALH